MNESFDKDISKFALACAGQIEKDRQALWDAIESGRVVTESGM